MDSKQIIVIDVKKTKRGGKRVIRNVRVAAYARVSTESDEQLYSLESQKIYYKEYIAKHKNWKYIGVYFDEGISGLRTKKRDGLNKMIEDAMNGKIDLILTKSISRFARNTVDTLQLTRALKEKGVGVYFEKERLDSLDPKSDFVLTILASVAEEESKSTSQNVTWAVRRSFAEGKLFQTRLFGYKVIKKSNLVINEDEAWIIRLIFKLFLEGNSKIHITKILNDNHIPTPWNSTWTQNGIYLALTNEKYMGDALLQKSFVTDIFKGKRKKNEGEIKQYYIKNNHEPIVSRNVYMEAQKLIKRTGIFNNSYTRIFSGKLKCGVCGRMYGSKQYINIHYPTFILVWECMNKYDKGVHCKNTKYYDSELECITNKIFYQLINEREKVFATTKSVLQELGISKDINLDAITFNNSALNKVTFRTIVNEIIVNGRTLTFNFIDKTTITYKAPRWSIINNAPRKPPKRPYRPRKKKPTNL